MPSVILPAALQGIAAKFERADESINYLNDAINALVAADSSGYAISKHFDNDGRDFVVSVSGVGISVPNRIPVLAGEILHHLRACLDHLIVALAEKATGTFSNSHQFPICRTREKFEKVVAKGDVRGVNASAMALIEKAQPFHEAVPEDNYLAILHYLDIVDKHRLLLVASAAIQMGKKVTLKSEGPAAIADIVVGKLAPISQQKHEICRIVLAEPQPAFDADVDVAIKIAFPKVGHSSVMPVIDTLLFIRHATTGLVSQFVGEFA